MSAFGSFGAPKPAGASIFGQPQSTGTGTSPFGAFGQPTTTQPAAHQTGGAFGTGTSNVFRGFGAQQQPQQQPNAPATQAGFGSFGAGTQQPQQQPNQPTQPSGGGLFGQPLQSQASQQGSTTTGFGGAFGAGFLATQAGAGQPGSSNVPAPPSLFSTTSSTTQPAATSSASPFGTFASSTTQPAQTSTFGGAPFGQSSTAFGSSLGGFGFPKTGQPAGASVLGQSSTPQQQPSSLTKGTKYTDLPPNIQQYLNRIQEQFQNQAQISSGLKARSLRENARKPIRQLEDMAPSVQGLFGTIVSDEEVTLTLRAKLDQAIIDETIATQIIDGFQDVNKATNLQMHAGFPLEYFSRLADQLEHRLQTYKTAVDVIERKLISLTENHQRSPQMISSTLRTQHATFQALASRVAELDAAMKKIRERTTVAWRAQTGSSRDPFDQRQGGLDSYSFGKSIFGESTS